VHLVLHLYCLNAFTTRSHSYMLMEARPPINNAELVAMIGGPSIVRSWWLLAKWPFWRRRLHRDVKRSVQLFQAPTNLVLWFHHHDEQQALSCSRTSMSASPQNQRCCTLPIMLLRSQATAEQRITGVPGCEAIQANAPTPKVHPLLVKISRNSDYMKRGSFIIGVNIFTDIDEYNLNYIC
jgi:hypothetical protein